MTRSTDKTEKPQKFSATLSQEEINEDFRAMTGCRPPTRPKKGPKNVQRIVDRSLQQLPPALENVISSLSYLTHI
uniref:Uncharacterized protein n=1 Tax=Vitis vinifera TaxID=29760 RepID=F6GV87_VITVI